jgi:competence protein ComGC
MKKNLVVVLVLTVLVAVSCVSLQDREMSDQERAEANIIGSVEVQFTSFQFFHGQSKNSIKTKAYSELVREARKKYEGNIDLKNIMITGGGSIWEAVYNGIPLLAIGIPLVIGEPWVDFYTWPTVGINLFGNFQKITATADVVLLGDTGGSGTRRTSGTGVEGALERAAEELSESFTARSRLAIVYITAQDRSTTDFISGELEHILRRQGFIIIDRSELDRIRTEQRFGASGEVDDRTAARIGSIDGANIVITGRVDGEGNLRRLRLRALETSSGQVIGTASERL